MTPEELHEEWSSGEKTGMRPQRIQRVRDDLMDITGIPIPRRIVEIEGWMDAMKGQITRRLNEEVEGVEAEENEKVGGAEEDQDTEADED